MDGLLIDTDVMIDVSRGNVSAASYLDSLSDPAISIITAQELIVGARDKRDLVGIDSLVSTYPVIHMDAAIGQLRIRSPQAVRQIGWPAHLRFIDRCYRDQAGLRTRQQKPQALRDDRRLAA